MREFTFDLVYEAGADPVADLYVQNEDLRVRAINAPAEGWFWQLARVSGPPEPLETLEQLRVAEGVSTGALAGEGDLEVHHACLERAARRRVFYTYGVDPDVRTINGLVTASFQPGVVVETIRQGPRQTWRLLLRPEETVGEFHDALTDRLREGVSFRMGAIRDATAWRDHAEPGDLPEEQRRAVRAAVRAGYYESPRAATLDEIAAELGIPRSTLSYRLRKAEAHLVTAFAAEEEA